MSNMGFQFGLICLVFSTGLILVVALLIMRHRNQQMRHQERLAALEKGVPLPPGAAQAPWSPRVYLLRGLIWTFTGAALIIALLVAALTSHRHYPESAEMMALKARNVSQYLQIPMDQARQIVAKDEAERTAEDNGAPAALALFGLIPLGVGLAYIIYYRSDASRGNVS
jgi:Domain of unknown function (DUF6249)